MIESKVYTLGIKDLLVYAIHGVFEEEKKQEQPFVVSAKITYCPLNSAGLEKEENEGSYLCYGEISSFIETVIKKESVALLETLVALLADKIFDKYPSVLGIDLSISKPQAPMDNKFLGTDAKQVSVEAFFPRVYSFVLSMGSNLGNREGYLKEACRLLDLTPGIEIDCLSGIYESPSWGGLKHQEQQPDFLNCCASGKTILSPERLLLECQRIEVELGRVRTTSAIKWQDRPIDIDILSIAGVKKNTKILLLPHKHMLERAFVLKPLAEIVKKADLTFISEDVLKLSEQIDSQGVHFRKDLSFHD